MSLQERYDKEPSSSEGQRDVALPIWLGGKKPGRKYSEQTAYTKTSSEKTSKTEVLQMSSARSKPK